MISVKLLTNSKDLLTDQDFTIDISIDGLPSSLSLSFEEAQELRNKVNDALLKIMVFRAALTTIDKTEGEEATGSEGSQDEEGQRVLDTKDGMVTGE